MTCPQCSGSKKDFGIFPVYANDVPMEKRKRVIEMPCTLCNGVGTMDDEYPLRKKDGEELRKLRLKYGLSLREFANRYNVNVVALSYYERGKKIPNTDGIEISRAAMFLSRGEPEQAKSRGNQFNGSRIS